MTTRLDKLEELHAALGVLAKKWSAEESCVFHGLDDVSVADTCSAAVAKAIVGLHNAAPDLFAVVRAALEIRKAYLAGERHVPRLLSLYKIVDRFLAGGAS